MNASWKIVIALVVLVCVQGRTSAEILKGSVEETAVIEQTLREMRPKWATNGLSERCVCVNPDRVKAVQVNGQWRITDNNEVVADFSYDQAGATAAVDVIRHYGFTQSCWAGRARGNGMHDMQYFKTPSGTPAGGLKGEDAISIAPDDTKCQKLNNSWKVTCGDNWLMDFGDDQAAAEQARDIIRIYGFTNQCFVGNPNRVLMYFRR